jgi:hypothetical protein
VANKNRGPVRTATAKRGFLVWLSGADGDTLARSPRERRKFSGLGGVVLTTSTMAAVSAAFALHNGVRAPLWASILVAVLWGLAIANLDRWLIVASVRRDKWWQNLATLIPRLMLAVVIGAVVSTPLVLWIFQSEIQAQLTIKQQADRNAFEEKLKNDARFVPIPQLEKDVAALQKTATGAGTGASVASDPAVSKAQADFDRLDKQYNEAQAAAIAEFDGTGGTGHVGSGSVYQAKLKIAKDLRVQRDTAKAKLDSATNAALAEQNASAGDQQAAARKDLPGKQNELARLKQLKAEDEEKFLIDSRNDRGLLAQIEALSTLTDKNATLKTAYLTLLIFITVIEILPVFTKFLLNIGQASAYDEILAEAERRDVEVAKANLKREQERREKEYAERTEREAVVDAEVRDREIARWRNEEINRVRGRSVKPAAETTRRPWIPGRRRGEQPTVGYNQWPDNENGDEPGNETTTLGPDTENTGWRFRD